MKLVLLLALVLLFCGTSEARLGATREQAEARYGATRSEGTPASARPLIEGAQELTFEYKGWQIRCALLLATDNKRYIVREEYTKSRNGQAIGTKQDLAIQDFERNQVFEMESGQSVWAERTVANDLGGFSPEFGDKLLKLVGVTGKMWRGPSEAIARMPTGKNSLILELPQALKHEIQLEAIRKRSEAKPLTPASAPHDTPVPSQSRAERQLQTQPPSGFASQTTVFLLICAGLFAAWRSSLIRRLLNRTGEATATSSTDVPASSTEPSFATEVQAPVKPRSFKELAWDEFEILVGEIYRLQGFSVAINKATGADGGVDLVLTRDDERVLVQCKNWNGTKVTAKEIREFFGVTVSEWATRGIFVTSSTFTRDAQEFAEGKPLELVDGEKLMTLVEEAQKTSVVDLFNVSQWAPLFALSVKLTTPPCPFCRSKMVLRDSSRGKFWGCSTFPRCRGKRDARRYLVTGVE